MENIIVAVRIRPENVGELNNGYDVIAKAIDSKMLVFDPKPIIMPKFGRHQPKKRAPSRHKHKDMIFTFDFVFNEVSTQLDVFKSTSKPIINCILDGINCSIFAYGATGAGKTFTMLGNEDSPGIIFFTMMELYQLIDQRHEDKIDLAVSYLEVYNECIYDLLIDDKRPLPLREDEKLKTAIVSGLTFYHPLNTEDLLRILSEGNKRRTQHPTDANSQSSRSHAVFQVHIQQRSKKSGINTEIKFAKLSLIDLAGSERATMTTNSGARLREGANINRSLLALGNVINSLAKFKTNKAHIPYRDSKLTRLLKDSLGCNCRTVMITNITPSGISYEDTYNSLRYANRAKEIKVVTNQNVLNVEFHLEKYPMIIQELKIQNTLLEKRIDSLSQTVVSLDALKENNSFRESLSQLFKRRSITKCRLFDLQSSKIAHALNNSKNKLIIEILQKLDSNHPKIKRLLSLSESSQPSKIDFSSEICDLSKELLLISSTISTLKENSVNNLEDISGYILSLNEKTYDLEHTQSMCDILSHYNNILIRHSKYLENDLNKTNSFLLNCIEVISEIYNLVINSDSRNSALENIFILANSLVNTKGVTWSDNQQLINVPNSHSPFFDFNTSEDLLCNKNKNTELYDLMDERSYNNINNYNYNTGYSIRSPNRPLLNNFLEPSLEVDNKISRKTPITFDKLNPSTFSNSHIYSHSQSLSIQKDSNPIKNIQNQNIYDNLGNQFAPSLYSELCTTMAISENKSTQSLETSDTNFTKSVGKSMSGKKRTRSNCNSQIVTSAKGFKRINLDFEGMHFDSSKKT